MKGRSRIAALIALFVCLAFAAGCAGTAAPLALNPAPWSDGEHSYYDVLDGSGTRIGTAIWSFESAGDGWTQTYRQELAGRKAGGEVVLNSALRPVRSSSDTAGMPVATQYGGSEITIVVSAAGQPVTRTITLAPDSLDNDQVLQTYRALPLAEGYVTRYVNVVPVNGAAPRTTLRVTGAEDLTVPAGAFKTWRVAMETGSSVHDVWYSQAAPYPLVKYVNRSSKASFVLRWTGQGEAPVAELPALDQTVVAQAAAAPNIPLILASIVQILVMLGVPIAAGAFIRRRFGISWGIFGAGMLTFVASQVVHLPLNWALGLLGGGRGLGLLPLVPLALVAGLSAGICEEVMRWLALRFVWKDARGWKTGLQFGAGHGGVESLIFGLLVLASFVAMLVARTLDPSSGLLAGQLGEQLRAAQSAYWATPLSQPLIGGLERILAMTAHIAFASLVMRSLTRRQPLYLVAAILLHALLDAWAVWASSTYGIATTEVGVALFAVFAGWLIWRLRGDEPVQPPEAPQTAPLEAANLTPRVLAPDELARRAESSKYE